MAGVGLAMQHPARHDTTQYVHGLGSSCAYPGSIGCALCTQPSFDSVHCYELLFGTLFMNTVHEVFKLKKKKKFIK